MDSSYEKCESELKAMTRENEAIRVSNESLLVASQCYKSELEALKNHANILKLQNTDLQKELDEFVRTFGGAGTTIMLCAPA